MIARLWRGATRAEDAEAYVRYLEQTGLKDYRDTPGNLGAWVLWRVAGDRAEFYPQHDRFLIDRELTVTHSEAVSP